MANSIEICRRLWNMALASRKTLWESERKSITHVEQCKALVGEPHEGLRLDALHSQVAQDALHRLDRAFRSFFNKHNGYPKFKKFRSYGSFCYPQAYNGSAKLNKLENRMYLSRIGNVRIVVHRPVPNAKRLKTCTVSLEPNGKWFVCLVYDDDFASPASPATEKTSWTAPVGIDLGLNSLITTSDGCKIEPQGF